MAAILVGVGRGREGGGVYYTHECVFLNAKVEFHPLNFARWQNEQLETECTRNKS